MKNNIRRPKMVEVIIRPRMRMARQVTCKTCNTDNNLYTNPSAPGRALCKNCGTAFHVSPEENRPNP